MTREEAIEILEERWRYSKTYKYTDAEIREAFDMAIEALEQEPCEDAISRHAAIDAVEKTKSAITTDGEIYVAKINAEMNIQQLPPVSTEKTGRWKKIKSGDKAFPESIVCSRCGYENSYINEWNFNNEPLSKVFKTSKYCPNCGAKMEVEK